MTIQEARNIAEGEAGRKLTDREFRFVLCYTKRKARLTGHDVSYVPLLLIDEIKNHVFRENINSISNAFVHCLSEIGGMSCV